MSRQRRHVRGWPRMVVGLLTLGSVSALAMPIPASAQAHVTSGYGRTIHFSGYDWLVKVASILVGPGPNYFSDSLDNVWTDDQGRLHLRISQDAQGRWNSAEVVLRQSLGYGTYQFFVDSRVDNLDPNVILGLFTWNDDPAQHHREMDIEFARWGDPEAPVGQYTLQPGSTPGHVSVFEAAAPAQTTHSLLWQPGQATFLSWLGSESFPPTEDALIATHQFTDGVPEPGGENVRLNLWLDAGRPPTDGQPVEVVLDAFAFSIEQQTAPAEGPRVGCSPAGPGGIACTARSADW